MINYDKDNIFSKILANEIPAIRVYEDTSNLVIMDAYPEKPGHMLAIPKTNSRNIFDITDEDLQSLCVLVKKISEMQRIAFGADGIKILHNCESEAGQVVFHTHLHIIPYFAEENNMPVSLDSKEKQADAIRKLLV
jgi:histidine triad (HIT) family protein